LPNLSCSGVSYFWLYSWITVIFSNDGSVEEAKKKMYACSTTTYTGFQAEIDEETAQKFEGKYCTKVMT